MDRPHILRREDFEISLNVKNREFLAPPDPAQRNWLITRTLEELSDDLVHLDEVSKRFVPGSEREAITDDWAKSQAQYGDTQLIISGQQVMQDWERPYMEAMAKVAAGTHGDVLEVGFGMGISASYLQALGVRSHTIIECNEGVVEQFEDWRKRFPDRDIRLVFGRWQDVVDGIGPFDSVFFDTYPLSEEEYLTYVLDASTFAEHFFEAAAGLLRSGGVFTYYSNEIDSVSRRHQRALFKFFSSVSFSVCRPLFPPSDCNYWWADSMVITKCVK